MCEVKQNSVQFNLSDRSLENVAGSENISTIRRYFSPAVYVETSLSPVKRIRNNRDKSAPHRMYRIKKCVCLSNPQSCIHSQISTNTLEKSPTAVKISRSKSASGGEHETISKDVNENTSSCENLSMNFNSLDSNGNIVRLPSDKEKEETFRAWLARKKNEKKRREQEIARMEEEREKAKQKYDEREKENFRNWLANKKKEEERRRKAEEKRMKEEMEKQKLKEDRMKEGELRYQLWLKRKEEMELDKKIKEQMELIKKAEEKEMKKSLNQKAYQDWLERSKQKPKPLPLNRGLESLKSSVSVTYVNPNPWNPNVDEYLKPSSK